MPTPLKPEHLRRRRNRASTAADLTAPLKPRIPRLPTIAGHEWHPLAVQCWKRAWSSPMAAQWLEMDEDALGRVAILWSLYYQDPTPALLAEIRLQEARFGCAPLDRARLSWSMKRDGTPEPRRAAPTRPSGDDPRRILMMVKP